MAINPFVELARDPVGALAWLGYLLLMLGIVLAAVPWAIRKTAWLIARWQTNKHTDRWWSFSESGAGYIPPAAWLAWAFGVCLVLAVAAWALGTLVWLVGV